MEKIEIFLSYILTMLGLIISTFFFLVKFIKNLNNKKEALNLLNLSNILMPLIIEAEKFLHYTKEEKKEYVTVKTLKALQDDKVKIDSSIISSEIDKLVSLTKQVNVKSGSAKELKSLT